MAMAKQIIILLAMLFTAGCGTSFHHKYFAYKYQPGDVIPADKIIIVGRIIQTSNYREPKRGVLKLGKVLIRFRVGETFKLVVPRLDAKITKLTSLAKITWTQGNPPKAVCEGAGLDLEEIKGEMVEVGTLVIEEHREKSWGGTVSEWSWQISTEEGSMWWTEGGNCWKPFRLGFPWVGTM